LSATTEKPNNKEDRRERGKPSAFLFADALLAPPINNEMSSIRVVEDLEALTTAYLATSIRQEIEPVLEGPALRLALLISAPIMHGYTVSAHRFRLLEAFAARRRRRSFALRRVDGSLRAGFRLRLGVIQSSTDGI
jgi:hypothetical protein